MQTTQADQPVAHIPKRTGLQFQTDEKEHQDHAELSEMTKIFGMRYEAKAGSNNQTGEQVPKYRSQPKPRGYGHSNDGSCKENGGLK
ncbi:hypothetical protein GCM10022290_24620 [Sagittula marina]